MNNSNDTRNVAFIKFFKMTILQQETFHFTDYLLDLGKFESLKKCDMNLSKNISLAPWSLVCLMKVLFSVEFRHSETLDTLFDDEENDT